MRGLALTYIGQGQYELAEPLLKEAQVLLNRHITTPQTSPYLAQKMTSNLNAYAKLYLAQGRYAEAEPILKRALEIWENVPNPDHPDMTETLKNLTTLYRATDRTDEADVLEQRIARIRGETIKE